MISLTDLIVLVPELFLTGAVCVLLLADLFITQQRRGLTHFLAIGILLLCVVLTLRPHATGGMPLAQSAFGGMFVRDLLADLLKVSIYVTTAAVFIYAKPYLIARDLFQGEFYVLCLTAVLGAMFMCSAGNLLIVYLGLELLSLSSYALVGMNRDSPLSSEAAIKYFVLGAIASGMLLYGASMIYGATGTLDLAAIHAKAAAGYERTLISFGLAFVVVGLAFKLGAAPFHTWMPDVYQGSPTAVTLFISSTPKVAAFGMAYRVLDTGLSGLVDDWRPMLAVLAFLSLAIGNIVAIAQSNLKRMLAYSTVSHIGFLLLGVLNGTPDGYAAATFYAITYAITSTASFGIMVLLSRAGFEAEEIDDFKGLNQRSPWYALSMLMVMASQAGVPVWVGFFAKFQVLKAALQTPGMLWLGIAGALFTVIGAFYYLRVIKVMYFDEPKGGDQQLALPADLPFRFVLSVNGLALLGLGLFGGPLMALCLEAVSR
ncbi:MAG TPA: NADH-quinone oxidoreductase subunit NuoN [Xanthomonadales bacterium]|nr:NADH-quinone oxidoreductase subunit NuoN [Xanthomonadales bacterium]